MSADVQPMAESPRLYQGWRVAALPMLVSLTLSAATVGKQAHWQDSAIYLTAIKEFSVLYPPGFTLYLLLSKAWTLLLGFVDFTLAVHLLSSVCAALAAGVLARAADQVTKDGLSSSIVACLAAAGYTWWFSGLYAKGYALFFLFLSLVLWRMTCRDHVWVALFSGLAWAAHPSAALLAPVLLLYVVRHRVQVGAMGARRLAWLLPASFFCALGPNLVLLPILSGRGSIHSMGNPVTIVDLMRYVAGSRFTSLPGVWGFVGWRWAHVPRYAWEEFLGVGAVLACVGVARLFQEKREERWALLVWPIPVIAVSALFKIEGQYDFWLVSAWMPLWIASAVGLSFLRRRVPRAPLVVLTVGLAWAVLANGRDLTFRGEDRPEALGRSMLKNLEPGAMLVVSSDDAIGLCGYLQSVRGYRQDVRVVLTTLLNPTPDAKWYPDLLSRRWPEFTPPDFQLVLLYGARGSNIALVQAAIVRARNPGLPPIYFDVAPPAELLGSGSVVPAGFLWKWTEKADERPDPRSWDYPVTLEQAAERRGRLRGISGDFGLNDIWVLPQAYEDRLVYYLALARRNQGDLAQREGSRSGYERSARAYESILKAAPVLGRDPALLYALALDYYMLDRFNEAAPLFLEIVDAGAGLNLKAGSLFYLGEIHKASRRGPEALEFYRRALEIVPAESPLKPELERRLQ
jgi:hypothetical protein